MGTSLSLTVSNEHRRIKTEEKAEVVAAVWWTECFKFLAALDIFTPWWFWRKGWNEKSNLAEWIFKRMVDDHPVHIIHRRRRQREAKRSSHLFGGQSLFNFLPRWLFCLGRFGRKGWIQPFLPNRGGTHWCYGHLPVSAKLVRQSNDINSTI